MSRAIVIALLGLASCSTASADEPEFPARLRIAFVSNREHYWYPRIVIYDHDGVSQGRVSKVLSSPDKRLDHQPALTADGKRLVYGWEAEGGLGKLQFWDLEQGAAIEMGDLNQNPTALFSPSLSADGKLLAFTAWGRAGASTRWDVHLVDLATRQPVALPGLNRQDADERRVAISGDGRWLAFTTNAKDGQGLSDIRLYDRTTGHVDSLAEMNSMATENYPALNHDGSLLAFISDRDGAGGMDVWLFDCSQRKLVALPGLNSAGQEQSPSLSGSGRYLVFVSERFNTGGEQDLFLYDREAGKLLATPNLNTPRDEFDPAIVELPAGK
jgi:Tol biopolymer transport system component